MKLAELLKPINLQGSWRKVEGSWWNEISPGRLNLYCAIALPSQTDYPHKVPLIRAFQASARTTLYKGQEVPVEMAAEVLTPQEFYNEVYLKDVEVSKRIGKWLLNPAKI